MDIGAPSFLRLFKADSKRSRAARADIDAQEDGRVSRQLPGQQMGSAKLMACTSRVVLKNLAGWA